MTYLNGHTLARYSVTKIGSLLRFSFMGLAIFKILYYLVVIWSTHKPHFMSACFRFVGIVMKFEDIYSAKLISSVYSLRSCNFSQSNQIQSIYFIYATIAGNVWNYSARHQLVPCLPVFATTIAGRGGRWDESKWWVTLPCGWRYTTIYHCDIPLLLRKN